MDQISNLYYYTIQEDMKNLELSVDKKNGTQTVVNIDKERKAQYVSKSDEIPAVLHIENKDGSSPIQFGSNRRFLLRPRKRTSTGTKENAESDELVNLYNGKNKKMKLDTVKPKLNHTHLETIFEEPVIKKNGTVMLVSGSRVKRSITFNDFVTKTKQKKRKAQIKKIKMKVKQNKIKVNLKDVQRKLDEMNNLDLVEFSK